MTKNGSNAGHQLQQVGCCSRRLVGLFLLLSLLVALLYNAGCGADGFAMLIGPPATAISRRTRSITSNPTLRRNQQQSLMTSCGLFSKPQDSRIVVEGKEQEDQVVIMPAKKKTSTPSSSSYYVNTTVTFPVSFAELMVLQPGSYVVSDTISVPTNSGESVNFCVKLFPRGARQQQTVFGNKMNQGFGMSYAVGSPFDNNNKDEKVGVYLQYLPKPQKQQQDDDNNNTSDSRNFVDASFALRLKGRQITGPRFDLEWRAGMRFVVAEDTKLADGVSNDFGAHLMQTPLFASFCGIDETNYHQNQHHIQMQVEIQLHNQDDEEVPERISTRSESGTSNSISDVSGGSGGSESAFSTGFGFWKLRDIRYPVDADKRQQTQQQRQHDTREVRAGRVVVPVLRRLSQRNGMFAKGVYPGVEYRILRILDEDDNDIFYSRPNANYELRPIYPLVPQLERSWPVRVNETDIPKLYTPNMYNVVSAIGSLLTAVTGLALAFAVSQAVSFFYIPSRSMDPTLEVGDVLLVEKVSPRLLGGYHKGDIVLFSPPERLREIVAQSGGKSLTSRDLFVKRIAAEPGDTIQVDRNGNVQINGEVPRERRDLCTAEPLGLIRRYLPQRNNELVVAPGTVEVLGDCSSVSIDSRVWGPLPRENIVGRPIVRLWPLPKLGPLPALEESLTQQWGD